MFKSIRAARARAKENTFRAPVVRTCRAVHAHAVERTPIQRVLLLARVPKKRKTLYRSMLALSAEEMNKNIVLLADIILSSIVCDTEIDRLAYAVLERLLAAPAVAAIDRMCGEYLLAQLAVDRTYRTLSDTLLRRRPAAVLPVRAAVIALTGDKSFAGREAARAPKERVSRISAAEPLYFTRAMLGG